MVYRIELLNKKNADDWNNFNNNHADGSFFHELKWKEILEDLNGNIAQYFLVYSGSDVVAICPFFMSRLKGFKGLQVLPSSEYNYILIDNDHMNELLLKTIINECQYLTKEFHLSFYQINVNDEVLQNKLKDYTVLKPYISANMVLDLNKHPPNILWNDVFNAKRGQRKYINRCNNDGISLEISNSIDDVQLFYDNYKNTNEYKNRKGFKIEHFKKIANLYDDSEVKMFFLKKDDTVYGSLYALLWKNKVMIFRYLSINRKLQSNYPITYPLFWNAVLFASENNYNKVNFGMTPLNANDTTYKIKRNFGCHVEKYYCNVFSNSKLFSFSYNFYTNNY